MLDRLLRRCPLLPSEVARIEQQLPHLMQAAWPGEITQRVIDALERRSPAAHQRVREQVSAAIGGTVPAHTADMRLRDEGRRVACAVVDGLLRLSTQRAVGAALYAVTNRVLGAHGAQALHWAMQTHAVAALLAQDAWLPWLEWLCQLPLPSLREGRWLEPLIAALPAELLAALDGVGEAHGALQHALLPATSPVRLMLLGTAWVLWQRQRPDNSIAPPRTATGRCLAGIPHALVQLELAGGAARKLLSPPTGRAAAGTTPAATLLPFVASAALLPGPRPAARTPLPFAVAGLALTSLLPAGDAQAQGPVPPRTDTRDAIAVVEALWSAWDSAVADGPVNLSTQVFAAPPDGTYAQRRMALRQRVVALYHQDDFLGALYSHRVPPGTLRLREGILGGRRVHTGAPVQLHPPAEPGARAAWSPRTAAMLEQLLAAATETGNCYDHGVASLECALGFVLASGAPDGPATVGVLSALIRSVEAALPAAPGVTVQRETLTLQWLRARIAEAKAAPVRGLPPAWPSGRPDPRSHLGHNLHLARGVLLRLSAHPALRTLCAERGADPDQLVFPAQGEVLTTSHKGRDVVSLFDAEQPPPALARLAGALRGLAALLHAPVRASGVIRVPEMLAYYAVPWPGAPHDDAPFDACLAALDQLLAAQPPLPATAALLPPPDAVADAADSPVPRGTHQAVFDRLWQIFDRVDAAEPVDLVEHAIVPLPDTPLARNWSAAQDRLLTLFEAPPLWLAMRQADASFSSLRVADGRIVVAARADARRLLIATAGQEATDPDLRALFQAARAFGCVSPSHAVPLGSALSFHGIARRPAAQACHAQPVATPSQRLQLLHQVHAQWAPAPAEVSAFQQAIGDLQDIHRLGAGQPLQPTYRPTLGTAAAAAAYAALGPFAVLLEHPTLQAALPAAGPAPLWVAVDAEDVVAAHLPDGTTRALPVDRLEGESSEHATLLALLRDQARRLGGQVRSDGRVNATRVLGLNGDCGAPVPQGGPALRRCAEQLLGELRLGLRPHLVHARDLLGSAQLQVVREATERFLARHAPPDTTLLEFLGAPLVARGDLAWDDVERVTFFLSELARTPRARLLQQALLDALDWYGNATGGTTPASLLGSLTVRAVVADLGPPSHPDARIVMGYRLRKHANRGRTFAAIRDDFQAYLYSLGRLPPGLHAMATTVALLEEAPELLAADIPAELVFGSAIAAVDYVSGVHLAERIQRGLSRQMNFTALVALSAGLARDPLVPDEVRQLALDARHLPLLDWLTFRSLDDERFGASQVEAAMTAFDDRVALINAAISDLLAPLPYRMGMVQAELERVFPTYPGIFASLPWNSTQLRLCNDHHWLRRSFPLYELYAAGELERASDAWTLCRVPDPQASRIRGYPQRQALEAEAFAQMQRQFPRLANINDRFEIAYAAYLKKARQGYAVLIEEALYLRPDAERQAVKQGKVEIFTLRTHEPQLEAQQETTTDTDPYRGRFGVIYSVPVDGQTRYFQLFPLQSRIMPLAVDGELAVGGALETRKVRLRNGHYATVKVRRGLPLNVDWDAYASYRVPVAGRQSRVIVERLPPARPVDAADAADAPRSPFPALVSRLQHDFFWLDPVALDHETRAPTAFEIHLQAPPLWLAAVDFIVPFVENLRKISSTNRDEFAMAAFGLYLEGVLIIGPLVGGVVKVFARPGPKMTLTRLGEVSRTLGHGTLDALNPLAGSLTIARLGVSVVSRGISGDLQFAWSRIRHPPTGPNGWRWAMRGGMAVLKEGDSPRGLPLHHEVRSVENVRNVLVVPDSTALSRHGYHLLDPATLAPYGPLLQPGMDSGNAAGMLLKVGEGLRGSRPSAGKVFKPIKQGTKTSQDDPAEQHNVDHPHTLDLAYPFLRPADPRRPGRDTRGPGSGFRR